MAKSLVGIDFGRHSVRAVEVEEAAAGRTLVTHWAEVALPEGAVVSGEVRETAPVTAAVRRLWTEGRFTTKRVVLGIGNERVIARELTMPRMASRQHLREALPFQVQEFLPVPVQEALLDFYPISESESDQGAVVNGLLVAAIKESVLANVNAVKAAGLTVVDVDLIPFALSRSLAQGGLKTSTLAIVDIGANTTHVVVTSAGVPQFVRMIPTGGETTTRALASRLEVPWERAEQIKREQGLGVTTPTSEFEQVSLETTRVSAHEVLNAIRNTLAYYSTIHTGQPLQGVVLIGGGSRLIGLSQTLSEMLRLQVVPAQAMSLVDRGKSAQTGSGDESAMTVALGLAMGRAA